MSKTLYERIIERRNAVGNGTYDATAPIIDNEELWTASSTQAGPETVDDFENNPTVIKNYEKVTDYLAENTGFMGNLLDSASIAKDGPAEAMRDDMMRVSTMVNKAMKMKDAPDDVKIAYSNLRTQWNDVSKSGAGEYWDFAKDIGSDIIFNYETLPAITSLIFSGGTAAPVVAGTHTAAKLALHNALKVSLKATGGESAKGTAAYVGALTGVHDLAEQNIAVDLNEQESVSLGRTAAVSTIGAITGGYATWGIKKLQSRHATTKIINDLENDGTTSPQQGELFFNEAVENGEIPEAGPAIIKIIDNQFDMFDPPEIVPTTTPKPTSQDPVTGTQGDLFGNTETVIPPETLEEVATQVKMFSGQLGGGSKTTEELTDLILGELNSGATGKQIRSNVAHQLWRFSTGLTARFIGKGSGLLTPYTQYSKTAQTLQQRLTYEMGTQTVGKQKTRVGADFGEVSAAFSGFFNARYSKAVEPLALNKIKGSLSDDVNEQLNLAIRGKPSKDKQINLAAIEIQSMFKDIGAILHKERIIDKQVENYIPRMWNRKAIETNVEGFKKQLVASGEAKDIVEAGEITKGMLDVVNQVDAGTGGSFFSAKRKFQFENDSMFTEFLNTDLLDVIHTYNYQAGKSVAKKKVLLSRNEGEFVKNWLDPIVKEMEQAGRVLGKGERKEIVDLYRYSTGENLNRFGDGAQLAADGYSLATQVALLPLATIGSLTEIMINVGKAGPVNAVKGLAEALEIGFKKNGDGIHKDLMSRHGLSANEAYMEMKRFLIGMEQAQATGSARLRGDDLASKGMQDASNKFFRITLLDQWTKFVQTATFASGKNMIKSNLEYISKHGDNALTNGVKARQGELNALNIDVEKGLEWLNRGAKINDPYYDQMLAGAARYTNSVILQPTAQSGLKPLYHSNPQWSIAYQLLGYPAAFTNTVLKGAAKSLTADPLRNGAKVTAAALTMMETARWANYVRSHGKSEEDISPFEARMNAFKRIGANGLFLDSFQRAQKTAQYTNNVSGYATLPFGPLANDLLNVGSGAWWTTAGSKVPFMAAGNTILGPKFMKKYRKTLREKDAELTGLIPEFKPNVGRDLFNKGGEVNVPNAPSEPDERINKLTGRPYNVEAGAAFMDQLDPGKTERLGFSIGGVAAKTLSGFVAESIDEVSKGLLKPELINAASTKIENLTGVRTATLADEYYDPDMMDNMAALAGQSGDEAQEDLENYVVTAIKTLMSEKSSSYSYLPKEAKDLLVSEGSSIASTTKYKKAAGYSDELIDEMDFFESLAEEVDPDGEIAQGIITALYPLKKAYNSYMHIDVDAEALAKVDGLNLGKLQTYFESKLFVDDAISTTGKKQVVKASISKLMDDPKYKSLVKELEDSYPSSGSTPDEVLPSAEVLKNREAFIADSQMKSPVYRGITSYTDSDFEIAFFSPREMGAHVGSRGQAQYMLANELNSAAAVDDFSLPSKQAPMKEEELNEFFVREMKARNETADDSYSQRFIKGETDSIAPLTLMEGLINVKNPLVFDMDMGNWSASTLLTSASEEFMEAVEAGVSKKLTAKQTKAINKLMEEAIEDGPNADPLAYSENLLDTVSIAEGELFQLSLTKKLQGWLKGLGFDSIKYRNTVEPALESESYSETFSYILFDPTQFKSTSAGRFDATDKRFAFNTGGSTNKYVKEPVHEPSRLASMVGISDEDLKWARSQRTRFGKKAALDGQGDAAAHLALGYIASRSKNPRLAHTAIQARELPFISFDLVGGKMDRHNNNLGSSIQADNYADAQKQINELIRSKKAIYMTPEESYSRRGYSKGGAAYTVKAGDNLTRIAKANNTTVEALVALNGIENANKIFVNQAIKLPKKKAVEVLQTRATTRKRGQAPVVKNGYKENGFFSDLRAAASTQVAKNFIDFFNPFVGVKTEEDYNPQVVDTLRQAAINARKDGRMNIDYGDYNLKESNVRAQVASVGQRTRDNLQSRMMTGDITPTEETAFSIGGATLIEEDGNLYAHDVYDFSKIKERAAKAIPDKYNKLRRLLGKTSLPFNAYESKILLGPTSDFAAPRKKVAIGGVAKILAPRMAEGFYSALEKAGLKLERKKGTAQAFINDLKKGDKVTTDELQWTGVEDTLRVKNNWTKEEVQDVVANSRVGVETKKGSPDYVDPDDGAYDFDTAYDEITTGNVWQVAELEQSRPADYEKYISGTMSFDEAEKFELDAKSFVNRSLSKEETAASGSFDFSTDYAEYTVAGKAGGEPQNYREVLIQVPKTEKLKDVQHHSEHFESAPDFKSTIAHLRLSDGLGGKKLDEPTLIIEEVQSDYHQQGNKFGYGKTGVTYTKDEIDEIGKGYRDLFYSKFTKQFSEGFDDIEELMEEAVDFTADTGVVLEELLSLGLTKEGADEFAEKFVNYKIKDLDLEQELASYTNEYNPKYIDDPEKANDVYFKQQELEKEFIKELKDSDPDAARAYEKYLNDDTNTDTVPEAPFKKTWHKLAINKALIEAAEEGNARVAITTGKQQQDRYGEAGGKLGEKYDTTYLSYLKKFGKKYGVKPQLEAVDVGGITTDLNVLEITAEMKADILKGLPQFAEGGLVTDE
tara:strand:+ start:5818 stop:13551 length:7734 start_codon:yes stop_codon:yes gene_type:complete